MAVGPGLHDSNGNRIPVCLKEGDTVLLPEYGGTEVKLGDKEYVKPLVGFILCHHVCLIWLLYYIKHSFRTGSCIPCPCDQKLDCPRGELQLLNSVWGYWLQPYAKLSITMYLSHKAMHGDVQLLNLIAFQSCQVWSAGGTKIIWGTNILISMRNKLITYLY